MRNQNTHRTERVRVRARARSGVEHTHTQNETRNDRFVLYSCVPLISDTTTTTTVAAAARLIPSHCLTWAMYRRCLFVYCRNFSILPCSKASGWALICVRATELMCFSFIPLPMCASSVVRPNCFHYNNTCRIIYIVDYFDVYARRSGGERYAAARTPNR